ncbi:MAG: DUF3891 family protein [Opitutales bacterium]
MIRIETPEGWILITHKDHARLAGKFAVAWDCSRFEFPEPRNSVLLGIASHDDSWQEPDSMPSITNDGTPSAFSKELVGSYDAFENIDLPAYLEVRKMATEACASKDPFSARMISMHTVSLLTDHADLTTLSEEQRPVHAAFIEAQKVRQAELTKASPEEYASEAHFQAAFELLQACDSLSLYCCALFPEPGALQHTHPMKGAEERVRITYTPVDETTFALDPFPFSGDEMEFEIPCVRILGKQFDSSESLRNAYNAGKRETLSVRLVSGTVSE